MMEFVGGICLTVWFSMIFYAGLELAAWLRRK